MALAVGLVPVVLLGVAAGRADTVQTLTVEASADASVNAGQPNTNRGSAVWVTADGQPVRYGFFRFTVAVPADATVTDAEFRCLPGSDNDFGASLWSTSSTWDEQTIVWSNAPLPDVSRPPLGNTGPVTHNQWASVDVTGQVLASGSYTFATSTNSPVGWSCASRENSRDAAAQLVLTVVPAPATPPSGTPASSTTAAPNTSTAPPPPAGHKMLVIPLENHSQSAALTQMPTLAGWAHTFGQADSYFAITHPSLPNYFAIWGGSTFGVTNDCSVGSSGCVPDAPSVWGQTIAAGGTAKAYQESMAADCQTSGLGQYVPRHGPWAYWTDAAERAACRANDVPSGTNLAGNLVDDIDAGALPTTGELTPNLCNDGHDCALSTVDAWLGTWLPVIMAGPDYRAGRLTVIITFDEDDRSQNNEVAFVVIDPRLHGVTVTGTYNHYSLTRWLDDNAGVPPLRNAASAADLKAAFGL